MANSYFQFKQFRIDQGDCGMKVTTEGCILGALSNSEVDLQPKSILDIGTGTGLLALMSAQCHQNSNIDAIEIDAAAFHQAKKNFQNSPWSNRLTAFHAPLKDFKSEKLYDHIICNPPFFRDNQQGSDAKKNSAIHNDLLPFEDLAAGISERLTSEGTATVLYPKYEMEVFTGEMTKLGLSEVYSCCLYDRLGKPVFRKVKSFSFSKPKNISTNSLVMKNNDGSYTPNFIKLLSPYYLHL